MLVLFFVLGRGLALVLEFSFTLGLGLFLGFVLVLDF